MVQAKKHGECGTCSTAAGRTTAAPKMSGSTSPSWRSCPLCEDIQSLRLRLGRIETPQCWFTAVLGLAGRVWRSSPTSWDTARIITLTSTYQRFFHTYGNNGCWWCRLSLSTSSFTPRWSTTSARAGSSDQKKGSLVQDPEFLSPKRSPRMVSYEDENLVRSPQIWSFDLCISCCSPYPVMGAFFLNLNDCNFQCMVQCRAFHWCDKAKNWTKANSDKKCHKRLSYKKVSYTFIMQICLSTLPTKCDILSS